jgi:hypothetical protein
MTATDSRVTTWHVCFDDEDTGGLPAGQRQAWCVRDFPGHVASRVDAIFPERPCGRVLGAASSDRNVRNRRGDCSAVCCLPVTRCLDVAGYGVTTFGRGDYLAGPSRGDSANRAGVTAAWRTAPAAFVGCTSAYGLHHGGTSHSGKHFEQNCSCAFSAAFRVRTLQLAYLLRGGEKFNAHILLSVSAPCQAGREIFFRVCNYLFVVRQRCQEVLWSR